MTDQPVNANLRDFWDRVSADWDIQVGDEGDSNRRLNSDPVLWRFAGDVKDLVVLDAGCGTGYLSRQLHEKGAIVTGVDFSTKMIEIAGQKSQEIDFHADSCSKLETLDGDAFDIVIANYVLMDVQDLEDTMKAFNRVLKPEGIAVVVFSHPCFPQAQATVAKNTDSVSYHWSFNYFEASRQVDPPWGHFTSEFIWFHRPLSDYWKAFTMAGFVVVDFEEPRITADNYHLAKTARGLKNSKTRPYSVAFKLQKKQVPAP